MTPKEKAEELIAKFSPFVRTWDCYHDVRRDDELIAKDASECGIILVNEILSELSDTLLDEQERYNFWQQVKIKLEIL